MLDQHRKNIQRENEWFLMLLVFYIIIDKQFLNIVLSFISFIRKAVAQIFVDSLQKQQISPFI